MDKAVNQESVQEEEKADKAQASEEIAEEKQAAPAKEAPQASTEETEAEAPEGEEAGVDLAQALVDRTKERDAFEDQLLRARADFDNYRKRTLRDMDRTRKTAAENIFRDLLPVLDNLERALQHVEDKTDSFAQGVSMVISQFSDVLKNQGVEAIPGVGEAFDPNVHEALSQMPSEEHPENVVVEEFERGYRINGYILRPSKVVVSSGPPTQSASEDAPAADEAKQ